MGHPLIIGTMASTGRNNAVALRRAAGAAFACAAIGCGPTDMTTLVQDPGPLTKTFAVSDHFVPSGFMGDGEYMGNLVMDVNNQYCKARPPGARGYCYRFTYWEGVRDWAGVFWVHPANNWGTRPGRAIDGSKFKQVRFKVATNYDPCPAQTDNYAARAKYISEHPEDPFFLKFVPPNAWYLMVSAFAGGISGVVQRSCVASPGYPYMDCPRNKQGELQANKSSVDVKTTTEWIEVHLNIATEDDPSVGSADNKTGWINYASILGAFGWAIEFPGTGGPQAPFNEGSGSWLQGSWRGQGRPVFVYLDDIVWDTEPVVPAVQDQMIDALGKPPVCPSVIPGPPDAGAPEAGAPDAGVPEAGVPDAAPPVADSGNPDADD